jgi:gamma-glutamyltranspeptidase/glutathione hydrolase
VALTTTVNTSFGSGVVPPSLGLPLNNEMDDFSAAPGVPNAYGLVGDEANAIAPGKRPLSSMSPTVVLDADGRVVMSIGASGGSTIISSTLQVYLNVAVFGMDPQAAVSASRIHHQWLPDRLFAEPDLPADVTRALEARGHTLDVRPAFSSVQVVVRVDGGYEGGSDPRKGGWPAVVR